ncbi:hypothetical protein [Caballeronia concitans]|uniref:Uncharacterized protein n=1 Tax=Caballeronia concitans TaxID=1777133 RepID=A0A658QUF8_9BURK|nr:hypothetical protein [Caballeronia concitans]KIG09434.1 hypothetical protein BurMR1_3110 [Burkholderia sp. MR1]SAL22831.1 hypothetical protein AWB72_01632 [Caballeronia concitans]
MYRSEDYHGWTLQVTTVPRCGAYTAIAVLSRGSQEFRFEQIAVSDTEAASATAAVGWLRGWLDLNGLLDRQRSDA